MIEADRLTKRYGRLRAASNVTFTVPKGEVLGFLGPNGAGKSTTMRMLTGFLTPTRGRARIGGFDVGRQPLEARRLLGYLPETGPLYGEMTVVELLQFCGRLRGLHKAWMEAALARVRRICHLEPVWYQTIDTLSKGYRRRTALAQALLHDPPGLILDEPTDGLDPNQKREVHELVRQMAEEKAIILSTHILEEVEAMCTRVIVIHQGEIVADATPAELRPLAESFYRLTHPDEPVPLPSAPQPEPASEAEREQDDAEPVATP